MTETVPPQGDEMPEPQGPNEVPEPQTPEEVPPQGPGDEGLPEEDAAFTTPDLPQGGSSDDPGELAPPLDLT